MRGLTENLADADKPEQAEEEKKEEEGGEKKEGGVEKEEGEVEKEDEGGEGEKQEGDEPAAAVTVEAQVEGDLLYLVYITV